jgi:hypothetical protein
MAESVFMHNETVQQQKKRITGKVVDQNNIPLIGANIIEKGTSNGAVTNIDGEFILNINEDAVINISYIGYTSQDIETKGKETFNIILQENVNILDELVVIGYGTVRRGDVTTAVSTVSTEDIMERPIISAAQAIQGKAAGVQVVQPSGLPGAGMVVRVRGNTLYRPDFCLQF